MTEAEGKIQAEALIFAKRNSNRMRLAKEITDIKKFPPDDVPISVFMAGSPGAGKTEFSRNMIKILEQQKQHGVIRIDSDEIRNHMPGYTGMNSHLFQGAVSLIVEKAHDLALHNKQTFVLDGTFSKYEKARANVQRSLSAHRPVFVIYVYQKPEVAWKFTEAREVTEGRNIPRGAFIEQFLGARDTVARLREEFGDEVVLFLVKKNLERNTVEKIVRVQPHGAKIVDYLQTSYTKEDLEKLI